MALVLLSQSVTHRAESFMAQTWW